MSSNTLQRSNYLFHFKRAKGIPINHLMRNHKADNALCAQHCLRSRNYFVIVIFQLWCTFCIDNISNEKLFCENEVRSLLSVIGL